MLLTCEVFIVFMFFAPAPFSLYLPFPTHPIQPLFYRLYHLQMFNFTHKTTTMQRTFSTMFVWKVAFVFEVNICWSTCVVAFACYESMYNDELMMKPLEIKLTYRERFLKCVACDKIEWELYANIYKSERVILLRAVHPKGSFPSFVILASFRICCFKVETIIFRFNTSRGQIIQILTSKLQSNNINKFFRKNNSSLNFRFNAWSRITRGCFKGLTQS